MERRSDPGPSGTVESKKGVIIRTKHLLKDDCVERGGESAISQSTKRKTCTGASSHFTYEKRSPIPSRGVEKKREKKK